VRVTHPFHPWSGEEFVFVGLRQTWGEDRVFFYGADGTVCSLPAGWTDAVAEDVFVTVAATAAGAVLMVFSMVINESLVARTFGTYTLRLFDVEDTSVLVPVLALGLILAGFLVSIAGNEAIGTVSKVATSVATSACAPACCSLRSSPTRWPWSRSRS
jgi:hypothetical protein